jgi:uncharacterized membrane-anchored protein YhcB (DUF1043 family)
MKACARVYAFSILFLCVGVFLGAIAQRILDEKQYGDEAIRLDAKIADLQEQARQLKAAAQEAEMWHSAFQACTAISSLVAEKADHESAKRRTDRRRVLHGVTSSAAKPGAVSAHRYVPGAAVASNEGAAPVLSLNRAGVAEMEYAAVSKTAWPHGLAGSSPAPGTNQKERP